ncbi:hypothetical protein D3C72_2115640 [compost metagenome]
MARSRYPTSAALLITEGTPTSTMAWITAGLSMAENTMIFRSGKRRLRKEINASPSPCLPPGIA